MGFNVFSSKVYGFKVFDIFKQPAVEADLDLHQARQMLLALNYIHGSLAQTSWVRFMAYVKLTQALAPR